LRRACSPGTPPTAVTTCPGSSRARRTGCGCPKSCCSRRRWQRRCPTSTASWRASPICPRWRRRRWMTCSRTGPGSATTPAPATCMPVLAAWSRRTAGNSPTASTPGRPCPALAARRPGPSWPRPTTAAPRFSTATCGACWPGMPVSKAGPVRPPCRRGSGRKRRRDFPSNTLPTTRRPAWTWAISSARPASLPATAAP
jgi:hypothetical protein